MVHGGGEGVGPVLSTFVDWSRGEGLRSALASVGMPALRPGVEEVGEDCRAWAHRDVFGVKPRGAGCGEAKSGLERCLVSEGWVGIHRFHGLHGWRADSGGGALQPVPGWGGWGMDPGVRFATPLMAGTPPALRGSERNRESMPIPIATPTPRGRVSRRGTEAQGMGECGSVTGVAVVVVFEARGTSRLRAR